ncbi:DUF167 domain-containing protein [Aspergillus glaucus CBS 516.65]|uniref:Uncharacterized protein n=1 Tax=Aspergillus glaucus CBS 516.65 TaxID=1160497 RepID=A0A1L9VTC0_ASPGL|nr:hypothetical protein ASPGLDRAFT_55624 [Aspergillus glaucus CBS 516.65]OJJ87144.1 hypothetical protein ASPGLDRAFT_55624 [Aspergillus glaucus CBS 516.65]
MAQLTLYTPNTPETPQLENTTMLRLLQQPLKSKPTPTPLYTLYLPCTTKPNARRPFPSNASGMVTGVRDDDKVDVSVSAPARDGEANTAVMRVFAKVFNTAPSNVEVIRGEKSREKVLRIQDLVLDFVKREAGEGERIEEGLRIVRERLRENCL